MPLYVSTFSTPMSNYTSFSILNILFTSLCSLLSLAIPFRPSVYMPPYYVFFSVGHTASLQFYHSFFLLTLYSGHRIFLLSYFDTFLTIVFFLLHFMHSTLVIFSLQFYTSWYRPHHIFLTCLSRRNSYP